MGWLRKLLDFLSGKNKTKLLNPPKNIETQIQEVRKNRDEELNKFLKHYFYYDTAIFKNKNSYLIKEDHWRTIEIFKIIP